MIERWRTPERREAERVLRDRARRERVRDHEGAISRGRKADIDVSQLTITKARNLRDPSDGEYWFVVGYSKVGGGDKVPPT